MIFEYANYRTFLKNELARRSAGNSSYSLRAFAKALDMAPSTLSEVFKDKKNISRESALAIAGRLGLNERETNYFISLVEFESAKSDSLREKIRTQMEILNPKSMANDLNLEIFRAISNWYHLAILEAPTLDVDIGSAAALGKSLGISRAEVEAAIDRLLELELLERLPNGKLRKTKDNLLAKSAKPNAALRKFHGQMLEKAIISLETQSNAEKFVGSETIAFDSKDLKEAEVIFEECFSKLIKLAKKSKKKEAVYHLGIQFFPVLKGGKSS